MPTKKKNEAALKKLEDTMVDDDGEEDEVEDVGGGSGRGKRKRRESKSYEPDDFTMASHNHTLKLSSVPKGRGKKLGDIPAVKSSMNKYKLNTEELLFAYKFVFSNRGTANKKAMKSKLLEFSGYLPPLPKGKYNKEQQDEKDEVFEVSVPARSLEVVI